MVKTFIRIPKSGTTSIISAISQIEQVNPRHLTVEQILQDGQEHQFYTMIRNPLQQSISMYNHAKRFVIDNENRKLFMLEHFLPHMDVITATNGLEEYLLNAPPNSFLGKFLSGLDPMELICVGHIDDMRASRELLNKIVGLPIVDGWMNRARRVFEKQVSQDVVDQFIKRNEIEYDLYNKSCEHFANLKNKYL